MRLIFIIFSFFTCYIQAGTKVPSPPLKVNAAGNIQIQGEISFQTYQQLQRLYQQASTKPTVIEINSEGGDALAAMLIGGFIHQHQLALTISGYCISACANYLFTASPQKNLHHNTLIVFHGGFHQKNLLQKLTTWFESELAQEKFVDKAKHKEASLDQQNTLDKDLAQKFYPQYKSNCSIPGNHNAGRNDATLMAQACSDYLKTQENKFFKKIKLSADITQYGQQGDYEKVYHSHQYIGFYYDMKDLAKLGIDNIKIEGGIWAPYSNIYYPQVYPVRL